LSQIGREAANSAPRTLASSSTIGIFSFSLIPLPTETIKSRLRYATSTLRAALDADARTPSTASRERMA